MTPRRTASLLFFLVLFVAVPVAADADQAWVFDSPPGSVDSVPEIMSGGSVRTVYPVPPLESLDQGTGTTERVLSPGFVKRDEEPRESPAFLALDQAVTGAGDHRRFPEGASPSNDPEQQDDMLEEVVIMLLVASIGLINGIVLCRIKIVYALTRMLTDTGTRRRMAVLGSSFALGIFVFYLAAGLGARAVVGAMGVVTLFQILAGVVAVLVGLAGIAAGVLNRPTFPPVIPSAGHDMVQNWFDAARTASPGFMLVLGSMSGFVELPATAGGYLGMLGLLEGSALADAVPLFLMYNICFGIPLVLMLWAVPLGLAPPSLEQWRREKRRLVRGAQGVTMVALGLVILVSANVLPLAL